MALAMSGETLVVGAPSTTIGGVSSVGAVYVFVRTGPVWNLEARILPETHLSSHEFGRFLALSGETLVVGDPGGSPAGAANVYVRSAGEWPLQAVLSVPELAQASGFGRGVAIDGETAIVGALGADGRGAAFVFVRNGSSWVRQTRFDASDGQTNDAFGSTVSVEGDTALVGAYGMLAPPTAAYVFVRNGTSWTEQAKLAPTDCDHDFGLFPSQALGADTAVVPAPYLGGSCGPGVYLFTREASGWPLQQKLTTLDDVGFGLSVALSGDLLAVGSPSTQGSGRVLIYRRDSSDWSAAGWLAAADAAPGDAFGTSVAISNGVVAVGARLADTELGADSGAVYVFEPFTKGDLNGDLRTDLVLRHTPSGSNVAWFMDGSTRLGEPVPIVPTPTSATQTVIAVDDFDGDGHNDLVMWDAATGGVEFWLMEGPARLAVVPLAVQGDERPTASADFNHDMKPDIVWRDGSSSKLVVWLMNGVLEAGEIVPVPDHPTHEHWTVLAALDCDGDGNADLLWRNADSGRLVQWLMDRDVRKVAGRFVTPAVAVDSNWQAVTSAWFAVGTTRGSDVIWRNRHSGRYVVWHLDAMGVRTSGEFFSPPGPEADPQDWIVVGPR